MARRYALSPQQLFAWRRSARVPLANAPAPEPLFVPAVVAAPEPEPAGKRVSETGNFSGVRRRAEGAVWA
ncbi:hypothetical protein [Mesorhizobium waimense]|uniref:hypothetical protein n=1 Tax=Mesorhizobium waimense TaxID=1300307 RepID=UPI003CCB3ED0